MHIIGRLGHIIHGWRPEPEREQKQSPRNAVEEQEHTCELFVFWAVGTCVFSQSHSKILIPGIRSL